VNGGRGASRWWSAYASVYDRLWRGPLSDSLADAIARRVEATGEPVVEVGTGTGLMAARLARLGPVVGVDRDPGMLARAAARPGRWVLGAAPDLPLRPGRWSTVVAVNLVHLCGEPEPAIAALAALLRPGGLLILSWPPGDVGPVRVAMAERAAGTPMATVVARTGVRLLAGLAAAATGAVRRTGDDHLLAAVGAVTARYDLRRHDESVLGGLAHLVVLHSRENP
jgi:SAM-dependent methyltransferase